ncbi:MAG: glycosyltransferase family 2 protein [Chthoniobacterales bacterium]
MISFVVPAYNEELELPATLASIKRAAEGAEQQFEIIVADDGSTDRTPEIAAAMGARVVPLNRGQIAAARNGGAREALGEILFFVDADTRITAAHVINALTILRNGYAGGGARMVLDGKVSPLARLWTGIFCVMYFGANLGAGAFLFTTRVNFKKTGGRRFPLHHAREFQKDRRFRRAVFRGRGGLLYTGVKKNRPVLPLKGTGSHFGEKAPDALGARRSPAMHSHYAQRRARGSLAGEARSLVRRQTRGG